MKPRPHRPLAPALAIALSTMPSAAAAQDAPIGYGCGDLVAIGRARSLDYTPVDSEDDMLGHGWITAKLKIRKVLRGHAAAPTVPVRYFAHADLRGDRDFLFVIAKDEAGRNVVRTARPIEDAVDQRLAARCG
ncbi:MULTISPECIES: hypothetical protein [unclassified Sphingomonas]|jgi:hypothetical protein|uniref:hypothetical protein n=1 Tax=Sphingomonas TaxID=13687 RepID=UPI0009603D19|nr:MULTISPECIES: hypothetical protein [unclassified Sphingomonas]MBN8812781.1 hypothetical protein [Sphingomonas sp.]OJY53720.1 MAG: hypothetical protein BGP17_09445 [Sphingomonas sp. 67-41]